MTSKRVLVTALILAALTVIIVLGGFWYWALFGFSEPIGSALGMTAIIFAVLAFVGFFVYDEFPKKDADAG